MINLKTIDRPANLLATNTLAILPLKGTIVYPYLVVPLMIVQPDQTRLVDEALMSGSRIGLFLQKDFNIENPVADDLYTVGTSGNILKMLRFPDGSVRFLIQGLSRIKIKRFVSERPYLTAEVEELEDADKNSLEIEALQRNLLESVNKLSDLAPYLSDEFEVSALNQDTPSKLIDYVASNLNISMHQKQDILQELEIESRMLNLYTMINKEIEVLDLSQKIQEKAASELGKSQREFILREQMRAIKKELGQGDDSSDVEEFEEKIRNIEMPEEAKQAAVKELDRMSHMTSSSAEYTVTRTYLDWMINLPWKISSEDKLDLKRAKEILDKEHYNLAKVKDRILEHLAVMKLKPDVKGPIICFVGPPGVGKTSLGKSVASAMGRTFARISLGGMRDEAEIRGHRRTYIGSMPGRIIQSIRRCGTNNPVIMLDEIDKLGTDFRGDPSSALLEVLDPEQNSNFSDHYLEVPFDLSKVMFITTANWLEPIPAVLRDRMEIISIPGYTELEKHVIAKKHLIPRQLENHGLTKNNLVIDNKAIRLIIDSYTREAGLRNLEREIASVARKTARKVVSGNKKRMTVGLKEIPKLLGPQKFSREELSSKVKIGVVPGLAYTSVGGDVLYIESTLMPGKSSLLLTGHLGDVMKESAQAGLSFIRSNAEEFNLSAKDFENREIHLHVPSGATPKDGPSAGITMIVSLVSLFTGKTVKPLLAMTGEITLRGQILPIGGLKEKLLAAYRLGIKMVILPEDNRKDSIDLPSEIKKNLKLKFFSEVLPAVKFALEKKRPSNRKKSAKSAKSKK